MRIKSDFWTEEDAAPPEGFEDYQESEDDDAYDWDQVLGSVVGDDEVPFDEDDDDLISEDEDEDEDEISGDEDGQDEDENEDIYGLAGDEDESASAENAEEGEEEDEDEGSNSEDEQVVEPSSHASLGRNIEHQAQLAAHSRGRPAQGRPKQPQKKRKRGENNDDEDVKRTTKVTKRDTLICCSLFSLLTQHLIGRNLA